MCAPFSLWRACALCVWYRWGPLSSIMFSLAEIDSSGLGGNDLMELVLMPDAPTSTRQMLLDTFMDGMLHKLFKAKW